MNKDPIIFIKHIMESIEHIESYSEGISKNNFLEDEKLQDAVIRRLEIIGEAVKILPKEFTDKYGSIPWQDIAGTRDKLIHHYFGIDLELTFDIIKKEIPKLKKEISKILDNVQN